MASRILGMGDILALVERARAKIDEEEAEKQRQKMEKGKFDLNDFRNQLRQVASMGRMKDMMEMIPGASGMLPEDADPEEEVKHITAILDSMTPYERANPDVIDISRRRRIAAGAGVQHHEVNKLIKMFEQMRGLMKQMASMSMMDRVKKMMGLGQSGALVNGAGLKQKQRSKPKQLTGKELAKARKAERDRKKKDRKRNKRKK